MKEVRITADGNPYTLTSLDARQLQDLLDQFRATAPDPVDEVLEAAAKLPDTIKDDFIRRHLDGAFDRKRSRNSIDSGEFQAWLKSPAGATRMAGMMLRRHHPHLTDA